MIRTSTGRGGQILCHFCNSEAGYLGRHGSQKHFTYSCESCVKRNKEVGKCKKLDSDDFKSFYEMAKREA